MSGISRMPSLSRLTILPRQTRQDGTASITSTARQTRMTWANTTDRLTRPPWLSRLTILTRLNWLARKTWRGRTTYPARVGGLTIATSMTGISTTLRMTRLIRVPIKTSLPINTSKTR